MCGTHSCQLCQQWWWTACCWASPLQLLAGEQTACCLGLLTAAGCSGQVWCGLPGRTCCRLACHRQHGALQCSDSLLESGCHPQLKQEPAAARAEVAGAGCRTCCCCCCRFIANRFLRKTNLPQHQVEQHLEWWVYSVWQQATGR